MSEDVSSKVKKIVADHLGIDEAKVTEESSFIDDLGADSLDTVELVMAFEEEFITKRINMSEEVSSKVKKIVADHLGIDEAKVTEESSFIDDLGADSLDTVELVMAFEEEFGSEISDSEAEKILTVGDAVKFIEGKAN